MDAGRINKTIVRRQLALYSKSPPSVNGTFATSVSRDIPVEKARMPRSVAGVLYLLLSQRSARLARQTPQPTVEGAVLRNLRPASLLFFLALTGEFFSPVALTVLPALYGHGAILVRDLRVRWGKGWSGIFAGRRLKSVFPAAGTLSSQR